MPRGLLLAVRNAQEAAEAAARQLRQQVESTEQQLQQLRVEAAQKEQQQAESAAQQLQEQAESARSRWLVAVQAHVERCAARGQVQGLLVALWRWRAAALAGTAGGLGSRLEQTEAALERAMAASAARDAALDAFVTSRAARETLGNAARALLLWRVQAVRQVRGTRG